MAGSKHDAECLRRKEEPPMLYVCSCGLTDGQVAAVASPRCLLCGNRFQGGDGSACPECGEVRGGTVVVTAEPEFDATWRDVEELRAEVVQLRGEMEFWERSAKHWRDLALSGKGS